MKRDKYSTVNQLWNTGAIEVQQLNSGGPDQRQEVGYNNNYKDDENKPHVFFSTRSSNACGL